ncbi:MAG: HAD-IA family hydrolase [Promethearchaeota archaeon]
MINNIIFDLGNVLFKWNPENYIHKFTSNKQEIKWFLDNIIHSKYWVNLDRGFLTLDTAKTKLVSQYPRKEKLILSYFNNWMEMLTPIEKNVAIVEELKKQNLKLYILSNYIKEAFDYISVKNKFLSLFDGKIISGIEKVNKPNKKIYKILIDRYLLNPLECVFIDDVKPFLRPAKKMGMKVIWNLDNTNLKEELKKLGIKF